MAEKIHPVILMAALALGGCPVLLGSAAAGEPDEPAARATAADVSESGQEPDVPESVSATLVDSEVRDVPVADVSGLARKYETLERELADVQASFAAARLKIHEAEPPARRGGLLAELERKALAYDAIQGQIEYKDALISTLQDERDEARSIMARQRKETQALTEAVAAQAADLAALATEKENLKKSLDLLRLGQYEYYEIKEGDTVESIAAQPTVYGDAARHVVIRQANRGHVETLDRLAPGEVLIIPRFPASGRYEF